MEKIILKNIRAEDFLEGQFYRWEQLTKKPKFVEVRKREEEVLFFEYYEDETFNTKLHPSIIDSIKPSIKHIQNIGNLKGTFILVNTIVNYSDLKEGMKIRLNDLPCWRGLIRKVDNKLVVEITDTVEELVFTRPIHFLKRLKMTTTDNLNPRPSKVLGYYPYTIKKFDENIALAGQYVMMHEDLKAKLRRYFELQSRMKDGSFDITTEQIQELFKLEHELKQEVDS